MKYHLIPILLLAVFALKAQDLQYDPSPEYPYGRPNPDAPSALNDWLPLRGSNECRSVVRNPDGSWQDTLRMVWNFKYIMNGTAVQDEVFIANGRYAGSLRQYNADSSRWYVSFYSSSSLPPYPHWTGNKNEDGNIVLFRDQAAPSGQPGKSRLTFSAINDSSFTWSGDWVSESGQTVYPFWKIFCDGKIGGSP